MLDHKEQPQVKAFGFNVTLNWLKWHGQIWNIDGIDGNKEQIDFRITRLQAGSTFVRQTFYRKWPEYLISIGNTLLLIFIKYQLSMKPWFNSRTLMFWIFHINYFINSVKMLTPEMREIIRRVFILNQFLMVH